jgi:hypothetical protein
MPRSLRTAALLALAAVATACTDVSTILAPVPDGESHPGFDTSLYPGDAAMRAWSGAGSPYEWVGYYLPAPCHKDTSWSGRRGLLASLGWGMAVLYVGQQTWEGVAAAGMPATSPARAAQSTTCSRTLLSGAQGTVEGFDAAGRAASEGFAPGATIYLDVEYMSAVTDAMRDYYRSWAAAVLADGRYRPGIYCHTANAATIHADVMAELGAVDYMGARFWIAGGSGFTLERSPADVGYPFASAWQGKLDVSRTWNGVTLGIDESVADRPSPSQP